MNHTNMTHESFKKALDTYGADFSRWPEIERALALCYVETSDEAKKLLADMGAFEKTLTPYKDAIPPADLLEKILKKAHLE